MLFVTPEYNRSVPGALKNAIDVGSRPYGKSAWDGKPCAIVSVSPGAIGAFGANHHLRQSLVFLNMPAMQQPEAYIGGADKLFDAQGKLDQRLDARIHGQVSRRVRDVDRPQRRQDRLSTRAARVQQRRSAAELADDRQRLVDRVRAVARRDRVLTQPCR